MNLDVKAYHRRNLDLAAENNTTNARVDGHNKSLGYRESLPQGWIEEVPKPAAMTSNSLLRLLGTKRTTDQSSSR